LAEQKKSSAMLPLILVGAALFGLGTYQSMKPKDPEVNTGFVAPPETPPSPERPPANPITMQAPDSPPMGKDAAQVAAEADQTTIPAPKSETKGIKIQISDAPWLQGIMAGAFGNFRDGVLKSLKAEQAKGDLNCAPVLTSLDAAALTALEKVACTAKDGGQISGEFDATGDGELKIEDTDGAIVKVSKNDGDFNVETRDSQ
jgi:hypothetical protein